MSFHWHVYPDETPEKGQVCLIRPVNPYYYADHEIATYIVSDIDSKWVNHGYGETFDLFEYPMWLSLDEIEEEAKRNLT